MVYNICSFQKGVPPSSELRAHRLSTCKPSTLPTVIFWPQKGDILITLLERSFSEVFICLPNFQFCCFCLKFSHFYTYILLSIIGCLFRGFFEHLEHPQYFLIPVGSSELPPVLTNHGRILYCLLIVTFAVLSVVIWPLTVRNVQLQN